MVDFNKIIENESFRDKVNCIYYIEYAIEWFDFTEEEKMEVFDEFFPFSPESPEYYPELFMEISMVIPKDENGIPQPDKAFIHGDGYLSDMTQEDADMLLNYVIKGKSTGRKGRDAYYDLSNRHIELTPINTIHMLSLAIPSREITA